MSLAQWLPLALVCLLGAMSPGPSLAVVLRHSLAGGAQAGVLCGLAHGVGIFVWALLMISGLGALLVTQPAWFDALRVAGALFLLYIGTRALIASPDDVPSTEVSGGPSAGRRAAGEGLLIALSNPKIAIFFAALFSQFIRPGAALSEQLLIAATAAGIDALWYAVVAVSLSQIGARRSWQRQSNLLNKVFGAILVATATVVVWSVWVQR